MSVMDTGTPVGLSTGSGSLYATPATGNTTSSLFQVGGLVQVVALIASSDAMTAGVNFQGSIDDTTFFAIEGSALDGSVSGTSTTVTGAFEFDVAGLSSIRFVISGYAAGHIQVTCRGTSAAGPSIPSIGSITTSENLAKVGGAAISLGQKASAASLPVVLPNDQTVSVQATTSNVTLLASAARTTTQISADQTNASGKYMHLILDVTANPALGGLTIHVRGKDPASGKYYDILNGASVTGNGTNVYRIGPGLSPSPNAVANDIVPRTFQVEVTAATADSYTYSVGYSLVGA